MLKDKVMNMLRKVCCPYCKSNKIDISAIYTLSKDIIVSGRCLNDECDKYLESISIEVEKDL